MKVKDQACFIAWFAFTFFLQSAFPFCLKIKRKKTNTMLADAAAAQMVCFYGIYLFSLDLISKGHVAAYVAM